MARHLVAVLLEDGSYLAVGVDDGQGLAGTLDAHHATRIAAGDIVALGALIRVGDTIEGCMPAEDGADAVRLWGDWDLEILRCRHFPHVHIFRDGAWTHETDVWAEPETRP
jgi:hypothetical protein